MTTIIAPSRIHSLLLDLARATCRSYGGAGFMLSGPGVRVAAMLKNQWEVLFRSDADDRAVTDLQNLISRVSAYAGDKAAQIVIENLPPQHVGLGSKTSLMLATLLALRLELDLPLSDLQLQILSGRGGTSGVGIHGFFGGGFVVDSGHAQGGVSSLEPSSVRRPGQVPDLSVRHSIPESWRFHLLLPSGVVREGEFEREFFRKNTPIPALEVFESIALLYHGIVPAVRHGDLSLLSLQLRRIHEIGFKARELRGQSTQVKRLYAALVNNLQIPVGLSSLGPLIYAITEDSDVNSLSAIRQILDDLDCSSLGSYAGLNHGFRVLR